ncbi:MULTISPECIES: hypothetical protein, partial [Arenibacter]|uniref:hypothetical protein n=1 Tax=Arenibacter TaxID=178469 RepID=UPI00168BEAC4
MKKVYSLLALFAILLSANCTRIAENNDPVIGIWSYFSTASTGKNAKQTVKEEWIFNDAYLGRFHTYNNHQLTIVTDFRWSFKDKTYTIAYPGLDRKEDVVTMDQTDRGTVLTDHQGNILAIRE